jgi:hypothetical protein
MNIGFMIFELVVQVFAFVTSVGYHLGLKQGRKPASLAFSEGFKYSFFEWIARTTCLREFATTFVKTVAKRCEKSTRQLLSGPLTLEFGLLKPPVEPIYRKQAVMMR